MQLLQSQKLGFQPCSVASLPRPVIQVVQRRSRGIIRCSAATTELPASLMTIVGSFQAVPDPMQRYKQLLFFATKLDVLPAEEHTQDNKVKGCVSQVWVSPQLKDDGKIYWRADSDSQLTKGLAALLVQGLSGCTAEEIVRIQPDFIAMLGLQQSLTPSRNNGFLNMFKLMQGKALEIYLQQQKEATAGGSGRSDDASISAGATAGNASGIMSNQAEDDGKTGSGSSSSSSGSSGESNTPVADSMRRKLETELQPLKLDIADDSNKHAGHGGYKGNANYSGETHFMVEVVSEKFEGLSSLKRHRLVYQIIDKEMGNPVHALSLITKTPAEAARIVGISPAAELSRIISRQQSWVPVQQSHNLSIPRRSHSNQPEHAVYSGPTASSPKRVTLRTLRDKYLKRIPISMVTAYDYPSAVHVDQAGIDMLLVGDSAAMVVHGHDTTLPITLDEMLVHCRAVARGARRPFLVGDMPFGCVETSPESAVANAVKMMKEGGMDAVKIEGGFKNRAKAVSAVVEAGVAVVGHVGLTPQAISVLGGFRPAGQSAVEALRVVREAKALEEAGCCAIVLECVPEMVAAAATKEVNIPTIGIGAGAACSGQVLVYHDLLGMMQHPHHAKVTPKFCKQYGSVGAAIQKALGQYALEVETGQFPSKAFSPYNMGAGEGEMFAEELRRQGFEAAADTVEKRSSS